MAQAIKDVRSSGIRLVDKSEFYSNCQPGDLVFCWGREPISREIEELAGGPSHVLIIWTTSWAKQWLTLESTFECGVHIGLFANYVDGYNGDLVLCRRPQLSTAQIEDVLATELALIGEGYDWIEELSIAARKLRMFSKLPPIKPARELYCSGLQQAGALNILPFSAKSVDWLTPQEEFTDDSVEAIVALVRP